MQRAVAGQQLVQMPFGSASTQNAVLEAAEHYHERKRLGDGTGGPIGRGMATDWVKVNNNSGGDRARGSVVGLGELSVDTLDPRYLWHDYAAPDPEHPWGIYRRAAKAGAFEEAQVSGVCVALVNVSDTDHRYARVVTGQHALESAGWGPIRLIRQAEETGEQELEVQLFYEPRVELVEVTGLTKVDGFYAGKILIYNPQTDTYTDGANVWLVDANE